MGVVPSLCHRGLTILQSDVILDYLAREPGHFEGLTEQHCWQLSKNSAIARCFSVVS